MGANSLISLGRTINAERESFLLANYDMNGVVINLLRHVYRTGRGAEHSRTYGSASSQYVLLVLRGWLETFRPDDAQARTVYVRPIKPQSELDAIDDAWENVAKDLLASWGLSTFEVDALYTISVKALAKASK